MSETNDNIIELVDEEGNVFSFTLIEALEIEGKKYAVLTPNDEDTDEALVLKVEVDQDGEEYLYEIEDDDEWNTVIEVWEALVEE